MVIPPVRHGHSGAGSDREAPPAPSTAGLVAFARGPVLAIAGSVALLLVLISGRYGYLSDELYFIAAGTYHPAWGYMDQQPLVPLAAAGLHALFPGSLLALRLPAAVITALGIVVTALIAREFGGRRQAQTLAAAAYALSPWLLLSGHWFAAATVEPLQWGVLIWLVVRWVRLNDQGVRRDRLLLWAGLVVAVAVQTKFQVIVLVAGLLAGLLVVGPRDMPRRPLLWTGAGIAVLAAAPTLVWQAEHGWPSLDMARTVDGETSRLLFLPTALLYSGLVVGAVLCCLGVRMLLRSPQLAPFRFLGWTTLGVTACYLVLSGRPNYLAGLYGALFAAGTVGLQYHRERRRRSARRWVVWPAYLLSALLPLALLPIHPLPVVSRHPQLASYSRLYETGWTELARTVADAYAALPPRVREDAVVVGESYVVAGALDVLGRPLGLPRTYSPHRGYWYFGAPPDSATTVLYVGSTDPLGPHFGAQRRLDTVRTHLDLVNIARGISVTLYTEPREPWSRLWPRLRTS